MSGLPHYAALRSAIDRCLRSQPISLFLSFTCVPAFGKTPASRVTQKDQRYRALAIFLDVRADDSAESN